MKRIIISSLLVVSSLSIFFFGCKNPNQKEIGEVEGLQKILNNTIEVLHSVDTNKLFKINNLIKQDLLSIVKNKDTLTREMAFKLDDFYGAKKHIYALNDNYKKMDKQLEYSVKQLKNLKQDLENNVLPKDKFINYFETEQKADLDLNTDINAAVNGINAQLDKIEKGREDILKLLKDKNSYQNLQAKE